MSVYESRYRPLKQKGREESLKNNILVMTVFEVRRSLSGRWSKVPLIFAGFFLFIALTSLGPALLLPEDRFLDNLEFFSAFFLSPAEGPGSLIWLHVAIINSGLIASDLGDNTFTLYMTKMKLRTYFLAKTFASFILTILGLPLVSIIYFFVSIYKRGLPIFPFNWNLLWAYTIILGKLILFTIFVVFLYSSIILLFSAYTKRSVNAGVIFIVFLIASVVIVDGILYDTTQVEWFRLLSPLIAMFIVYTNFFNLEFFLGGDGGGDAPVIEPESPSLAGWAVLSTITMATISLILTYRKLNQLRSD